VVVTFAGDSPQPRSARRRYRLSVPRRGAVAGPLVGDERLVGLPDQDRLTAVVDRPGMETTGAQRSHRLSTAQFPGVAVSTSGMLGARPSVEAP